MKIKAIKTYRLRSRDHFMFMTEVKNIIESIGPDSLDVSCLFKSFLEAYRHESIDVQNPSLSSNIIKMLEESDEKRDNYYRGIELITKGFLRHGDRVKKNAAETVYRIIKRYGDIRYISYEDETVLVKNFCLELKRYPQEVKSLHLDDWLEMLDSENNTFQYLLDSIKKELIFMEPTQKIRTIRQQVDFLYKEIVSRINALLMIEGEYRYKEYIEKINAVINKYLSENNSPLKETKMKEPENPPVIPEAFY